MQVPYEKSNFQEYLEELLAIPASDILVHCDHENKQLIYLEKTSQSPISLTLDVHWKRLLAFANSVHKTADTHTLCLAWDTVTLDGHHTPIWLIPIQTRIQKNTNYIEVSFDLEEAFLNPYLSIQLQKFVGESVDFGQLETFEEKEQTLQDILKKQQFEIIPTSIVGNFHHHRYLLVKELEELQQQVPSALVDEMFANEKRTTETIMFNEGNITSLDSDQQEVIEQLKHSNLVVEGPPGTGKSELIASIIGKSLPTPTNLLLVSEKKTALEVIQKKLAKYALNRYAFVVSSETRSKDLVEQLQQTWKFLENETAQVRQPITISQQKRAGLQLLLDKLTAKELVGGISFSEFLKLIKDKALSEVPYLSNTPSLEDWNQQRTELLKLYTEHPRISQLHYFQKNCFESSVKLDEIVASFQHESAWICSTFDVSNLQEVEQLISEVIYAQIIENEVVKKHYSIFENERKRAKFKKLYFNLQKKQYAFELIQSEAFLWHTFPTNLQLETWEKLLTTGSWWTKRKTIKQILLALKDTTLPLLDVISSAKNYLAKKNDLASCQNDLLQIGIQAITSELESVYQMILHWESHEDSSLQRVAKTSSSKRMVLLENNPRIKDFIRLVSNYFSFPTRMSLKEVEQIIVENYTDSLPFATYLNNLPNAIYGFVQQAPTFEALEKFVFKAHLVQLENNFPVLRTFSGEKLKEKIEEIIRLEQEEQHEYCTFIHSQRTKRFQQFHQLLQTPSTKLSAQEKELKARLKKGKTILIKEFAKTRHTQSIRTLINSEANEWIQLLLPIWLCTPGQVATSFPMKQGMFDLVIFDEASQLPLTHALGSLQRSKHALVCGDSKQMSPSSYFSKKSEQIDLLHHASYYWKTARLTHHYRSQHPALIAFSNKHFYQNQLVTYPTATKQNYPISLNYCEKGLFTDRKNEKEAIELVRAIEKMVLTSNESIGVVAFSQQQLTCIWEQLSLPVQEKLNENIATGKGFFKTLEQVQGEECEQLFISIGYGKNEHGKFHLRMGPLNRRNGYRRLNVLFTRAQKHIHVFTSVKSSDFALCDNESIELLRLYIHDVEKNHAINEVQFPYQLSPSSINDNEVVFDSIYDVIPRADEILTFHEVMSTRKWDVNY